MQTSKVVPLRFSKDRMMDKQGVQRITLLHDDLNGFFIDCVYISILLDTVEL